MTVRAGSGSAAPGVSVTHEVLWSTDPRISPAIDATGGTDCTAGLQAMANLMVSGPQSLRVGYLIPGLYKKSGEITFANGTTGMCVLKGAGSKGNRVQAPTVVWDVTDAGAGKFSIKPTGSAGFSLYGINFQGSQGGASAGGTHGYAMRGIAAINSGTFQDTGATGYAAGLGIATDHVTFIDTGFQGNDYGVEFLPLNPTQGDIHFYGCLANACAKASIAVASSSQMAGVDMRNFSASTSPYCVLRYSDGLGQDISSSGAWIDGWTAENFATEYTGNGIVYDAVGNGAQIKNVVMDHGALGNWSLYTSFVWVGQPQSAAWYNSGQITAVRFVASWPSSTSTAFGNVVTAPSLLAPALSAISCEVSAMANDPTQGAMTFALSGNQSGAHLGGSYGGDKRGLGQCTVPYVVDVGAPSSISLGYCVTRYNGYNVSQYAGTGLVLGVAAHNAPAGTAGQASVVHVNEAGSPVSVMNTSGASIADKALLTPHSGGGVQTYAGSGQIIGTAYGAIAASTLGQGFIRV